MTQPKPWWVFRGPAKLQAAPPWRRFDDNARATRGSSFLMRPEEIDLVNAALYLRRPLLVTGKPGTGKTTLAYAVARELELGPVLLWPITTRTTLQDGLYHYDAIARLQDASLDRDQANRERLTPDIGDYVRLGPLGTALLPTERPRVLLIDEVDKSDIDLPNDLLNIFEEGEYEIPELARVATQQSTVTVQAHDGTSATIRAGRVLCDEFPFVVLTSNGEREFPPAFLRRCLRLEVRLPDARELATIVRERLRLTPDQLAEVAAIIEEFVERRDERRVDLATDQLLNAIYLAFNGVDGALDEEVLRETLFRPLSGPSAR